MKKLGLYNIDGVEIADKENYTLGAYGRAQEQCDGKNSPVGHWEISGFIKHPGFKTYPNAFPQEMIDEFIRETGCGNGSEIYRCWWLVERRSLRI